MPWTYEQLKVKVFTGLKRITNILVLIMAIISLVSSLLSPELIKIMGTQDYQVAVYVIPVVVLGVYYTFVYDLYASVEFYYGATQYVMYASLIGAGLNFVLNAVFIPLFGFIAAAYTTLVCYLVFMLMHFLFSRKVLKEQNITEAVYDNKTIFGLTGLITMIGLGCMASFPFFWVRMGLIALIIVVCIVKRETIKNILKTMKR